MTESNFNRLYERKKAEVAQMRAERDKSELMLVSVLASMVCTAGLSNEETFTASQIQHLACLVYDVF